MRHYLKGRGDKYTKLLNVFLITSSQNPVKGTHKKMNLHMYNETTKQQLWNNCGAIMDCEMIFEK